MFGVLRLDLFLQIIPCLSFVALTAHQKKRINHPTMYRLVQVLTITVYEFSGPSQRRLSLMEPNQSTTEMRSCHA